MTHRITTLRLAFSVLAVLSFAATASATPFIAGFGWITTEANSQNASPATLASSTCQSGSACTAANADVTFNASGIGFNSFVSNGYTLSGFLNSEGFASNIVYNNGTLGTRSIDPMLFRFTGSALFTNGQIFTVNHDDGATLIVGGVTVLNAPGPTAPTTSTFTYTGATGTQSFDFIYGECCGSPAVFETTLVPADSTPVPEPASLVLFGTGLIGLARKRLRRK